MVLTPWGESNRLRERMLPPGRGRTRAEAARSQRERLFAAAVATVAEQGYKATPVADLVRLSGVSRSAFYQYFDDKQACCVEAGREAIGLARGALRSADRGRPRKPRSCPSYALCSS